jgi:hypothetical protein
VTGACNPRYSGGRDQEDPNLKQIVCKTLSSKKKKKLSQKRASGVAQSVGPEFKPQYLGKKKKKVAILLSHSKP